MTAATGTPAGRSGIPILGQLSMTARIAVLVTVVVSVVAILLEVAHADKTVIFVVSAAAILGLAWVVGLSTERLGSLTGPQVGGILNATFGNIAELIIAFFALQRGLIEVVQASLTGSIIGNLLLVMGAAVLVGGLRNGVQTFSAKIAISNAALLVLALIGLFVPAIFALTSADRTTGTVTEESVLVVIVPTIGNLAELLVAVQLAAKDKMEFALAVTFGSSLQVALFVAPVLVLLGLVVNQPMTLVFTPLEIAAVGAAVASCSLSSASASSSASVVSGSNAASAIGSVAGASPRASAWATSES